MHARACGNATPRSSVVLFRVVAVPSPTTTDGTRSSHKYSLFLSHNADSLCGQIRRSLGDRLEEEEGIWALRGERERESSGWARADGRGRTDGSHGLSHARGRSSIGGSMKASIEATTQILSASRTQLQNCTQPIFIRLSRKPTVGWKFCSLSLSHFPFSSSP